MSYKRAPTRVQYVLDRKRKVAAKVKKPVRVKPKEPAVASTSTRKLAPGYKATLRYKSHGISVTAKVRYETEKVDPLIKTTYVADGEVVHREWVGPKKEEVWLDANGKQHNKDKVELAQVLPDGKLKPIHVTRTTDFDLEPVPKEVMDDFHPYSWIEIWGENEKENDDLRTVAADLLKTGRVGAIKEFSHGFGKMYVGFVRPVLSKDGKSFVLEMMASENRRTRRRWMSAEKMKGIVKEATAPEVPKLW